jgi:kynureninase
VTGEKQAGGDRASPVEGPPPGEPGRDLLAWRAEFPILGRCNYLVNGSLGAMPRGVEAELARYTREWGERGVRAWGEGWWEVAVATGDLVAPLVGAGAGTIAMHANVTIAAAVFLSALDYPPSRPRIVLAQSEFPTLQYVLDGERRRGAELLALPADDPRTGAPDLARWRAAIDERTRLVVVSHALFRTGALLDVAAIARAARDAGALTLVDVYQTAGAVPVDLEGWGVDAAVGGGVKWLCAGPGAGYLWVRPALAATLTPATVGWQADEEPFAFRGGAPRHAAGSWRFLTGTPNVPGLYAARAGLRIIGEIGVERIRRRSLHLTGVLLGEAEAAGLATLTPRAPERRGAAVTVAHPDAERLTAELLRHDIVCDFRPGAGIRFSPHFYNTVEECRDAMRSLARLATGSPPVAAT